MHLEIGDPEYVKVFPDFQPMPAKCPRISKEENQSKFAYSSPFQVFSQEGLKVLKEIIRREENQGVYSSRGHKIALRGLYYLSPWVRDLQACTELRDHFCNIAGEELVPHPSFCNSPQVSRVETTKCPNKFCTRVKQKIHQNYKRRKNAKKFVKVC